MFCRKTKTGSSDRAAQTGRDRARHSGLAQPTGEDWKANAMHCVPRQPQAKHRLSDGRPDIQQHAELRRIVRGVAAIASRGSQFAARGKKRATEAANISDSNSAAVIDRSHQSGRAFRRYFANFAEREEPDRTCGANRQHRAAHQGDCRPDQLAGAQCSHRSGAGGRAGARIRRGGG